MLDLEIICQILNKKTCSEHGKHPSAIVSDNEIKISCCCNSFFGELQYHQKNITEKDIVNVLDSDFKAL
jgi:hypothetical protein